MTARTLITGTAFVAEQKGTLAAIVIYAKDGTQVCRIVTANIAIPKGEHYIVVELED